MRAFHDAIIPMNAVYPRKLQIVVLAAGFSSRFGRPKAACPRARRQPVAKNAACVALSLGAARIIVVVPRNAARYRVEARGYQGAAGAANARRAQGLSSSVRRGIAEARYASAVLLMPADLIHLKNRELHRLVRRWQSTPRRLIARRIGFSGATPVDFAAMAVSARIDVDRRCRSSRACRELPEGSRVLVDMPSAAQDVDTPQDLRMPGAAFGPIDLVMPANADIRETPGWPRQSSRAANPCASSGASAAQHWR